MTSLNDNALEAAYASAPAGKRDKNLIATAVRAYLDAAPIHDDAEHALRSAYVALAFAFQRLHSSARSRDGELCQTFLKIRADIETVMRAHGRTP